MSQVASHHTISLNHENATIGVTTTSGAIHTASQLAGAISQIVVTIVDDNVLEEISDPDAISEDALKLMIQVISTEPSKLRDAQLMAYTKEFPKFTPDQHWRVLESALKLAQETKDCDLGRCRFALRLLFEFVVRQESGKTIPLPQRRNFFNNCLFSILNMFRKSALTDVFGTATTTDLVSAILECPNSIRILYKLTQASSILVSLQAAKILSLVFHNSGCALTMESWPVFIQPTLRYLAVVSSTASTSATIFFPLARELALHLAPPQPKQLPNGEQQVSPQAQALQKPYSAISHRLFEELESNVFLNIAHGMAWLHTQRNFDPFMRADCKVHILRKCVEKAFEIPSTPAGFSSPVLKAPAAAMHALALFLWPPEPHKESAKLDADAMDKWKERLLLVISPQVAPDFVQRVVNLFEIGLSEELWRKYAEGHERYCPEAYWNELHPQEMNAFHKRMHRFAPATQLAMAMNCLASLTLCEDMRPHFEEAGKVKWLERLTAATKSLFDGYRTTGSKDQEEWQKKRDETCSWTACWSQFVNRGKDEGWPLYPMQYGFLLVQVRASKFSGIVHTDESRVNLAMEIKRVGNSCYGSNNFQLAAMSYTIALEMMPSGQGPTPPSPSNTGERVTLFSNRAQSYMQLNNGYWALADLDQALTLDKTHQKSIARRKSACNMILLQSLQSRTDTPLNRYHEIHLQITWAKLKTAAEAALAKQSTDNISSKKGSNSTDESTQVVSAAEADATPGPVLVDSDALPTLCGWCYQRPFSAGLIPCSHMLCNSCASSELKTKQSPDSGKPQFACPLCDADVKSTLCVSLV